VGELPERGEGGIGLLKQTTECCRKREKKKGKENTLNEWPDKKRTRMVQLDRKKEIR